MQGAVAVAVMNQAQRMEKSLGSMIGRLEETIAFIQKTVRHYELLDEQIKQAIQAAASAAAAVQAASAVNAQNTKNTKGGGTPVKAGISGVLDSLFGKK